jgi:hypothetical protein
VNIQHDHPGFCRVIETAALHEAPRSGTRDGAFNRTDSVMGAAVGRLVALP